MLNKRIREVNRVTLQTKETGIYRQKAERAAVIYKETNSPVFMFKKGKYPSFGS